MRASAAIVATYVIAVRKRVWSVLSPVQAEKLLDMGIHPLRVAEGYEMACKVAIKRLEAIADSFDFSTDNLEPLIRTCMTTLSSKMWVAVPVQRLATTMLGCSLSSAVISVTCPACAMQLSAAFATQQTLFASRVTSWHLYCSVGRCKREQAEMCVKAVLAVADLARKDVNLELIKVGTHRDSAVKLDHNMSTMASCSFPC
jgi:hypothetical protein